MSCQCDFKMNSILNPYRIINESYPKMPCEAAVNFLNKLNIPKENPNTNPQSDLKREYPEYRVFYNITNGEENYSNNVAESPEKAAAKIQLFMQNPNWMPTRF